MGKQAQTQEKALYNEAEGRGLHEGTHQTDDRSFRRTGCH